MEPLELFKAVEEKDINKVKALINAGADVNSKDVHGSTPLAIAIVKLNKEGNIRGH